MIKILLVAGHGDGDPGAIGCGYREADLTRELVAKVADKLSPYAYVTIFNTAKNMYEYLKTNTFNFKDYYWVGEFHFNALKADDGDGKNKGIEILVHPSEAGVSVEEAILKHVCNLGFTNRGIKNNRTDLQNMNICKGSQGVSYALIETCFIDDADDMKLYQKCKNEVADAIVKGIADGFGLSAEPATPSLLTSANDITWELNHAYFPITETANFVKALDEAKNANSPLYWGYYKLVNNIK